MPTLASLGSPGLYFLLLKPPRSSGCFFDTVSFLFTRLHFIWCASLNCNPTLRNARVSLPSYACLRTLAPLYVRAYGVGFKLRTLDSRKGVFGRCIAGDACGWFQPGNYNYFVSIIGMCFIGCCTTIASMVVSRVGFPDDLAAAASIFDDGGSGVLDV